MQNREPTYPGRVTLTPVAGLANTYDMERADQPLQQGTPLTKATFLKDATAALFGKTNAAVPDDILNLLSKSVLAQTVGGDTTLTDVLGTKLTVGVQIETGSYVGTGTYGQGNPNTLTFGIVPKILIVMNAIEGGVIVWNPVAARGFLAIQGAERVNANVYDDYTKLVNEVITWAGKTVSWYAKTYSASDLNANCQLNHEGVTYIYIAIG